MERRLFNLLDRGDTEEAGQLLRENGITIEKPETITKSLGLLVIRYLLAQGDNNRALQFYQGLPSKRKRHLTDIVESAPDIRDKYRLFAKELLPHFEIGDSDVYPFLFSPIYREKVLTLLEHRELFFKDCLSLQRRDNPERVRRIPLEGRIKDDLLAELAQLGRIRTEDITCKMSRDKEGERGEGIVVDGANIVYYGEKSFLRLHRVLQQLKAKGYLPLTILNERHRKDFYRNVSDRNVIFSRRGVCDDFWSLYFSLKGDYYLLSRDYYRDHISISCNPQEFKRWLSERKVGIFKERKRDKWRFEFPPEESRVIQKVNHKWYLPCSGGGWLVVESSPP